MSEQRDEAGKTAKEFADELFEWEYCAECHGDTEDHAIVIGPFGLWFALCLDASDEAIANRKAIHSETREPHA